MKIFVTGAAGFIGYHVVGRLLREGHEVTGYDGITPYYDVALKRARVARLHSQGNFRLVEGMLEDDILLKREVAQSNPEVVLHLGAQAGVRYAFEAPRAYMESNVVGTFNLLEALKDRPPSHLLFASTSSVYGGNIHQPSEESDRTDFQMSLYAATKKSGEALCHAYAHLFNIPTTTLRFFTVYGPWGRPDMALFTFVRKILAGEPIDIFGHGHMRRDFTYVDDLTTAVLALIRQAPRTNASRSHDALSPVAPYQTVNVAGGNPVPLMSYVEAIEAALDRKAVKNFLPMQPGDVVNTHSDPQLLAHLAGATPKTSIEEGVRRFVDWYVSYYVD